MACDQSEKAWTLSSHELDAADVVALLGHHFSELRAESPPEACHVMPADALRHPDIGFFTLRERDGSLLAIGALKTLNPSHGEVKSMRTHPDALRRGAGKAILDHIIAHARACGMTRLSLETGNSPMFGPANRLYERAGFKRCGPFGDYAATEFTHFYTRSL